MDLITTPAATGYTPPATSIVHQTSASMTDRAPSTPVHLTQYDTTMPVIEVALTANGQPYSVPSGAAVNVRLAKPDGTYVYNPALGVSADGQTAYIGTTVQMTTAWGRMSAIVEVVLNGAVAGTGTFVLEVTENPVPEAAIESTSEFLTIQQLYQQIQQAATLLEEQSQNLQNVTDNLAAIQGAANNAQAAAQSAAQAAQSAAQAAQSAQQALGFRTFFSAVSPDENGDLDLSRPMTTAAAQASWTVKSKGDRIQSVQVKALNTSGSKFVEVKVTSDLNWTAYTGQNLYFEANVGSILPENAGNPAALTRKQYCTIAPVGNAGSYESGDWFWVRTSGENAKLRVRFGQIKTVDDLKKYLDENNVFVWYVPENEEEATGIYIPIIAQGHEYRCQCLPITEALGVGDSVISNILSGCNESVTFDGSLDEQWAALPLSDGSYRYRIQADWLPSDTNLNLNPAFSDWLSLTTSSGTFDKNPYSFTINTDGNLYIYTDGSSLDNFKSLLAQKPLTFWYCTKLVQAEDSIPVELETHANGVVYAHPAIELVAVPYTESDVTAAHQLASTPSTLPYIEDSDVPMLLDSIGTPEPDVVMRSDGTLDADNTQKAADWIENTAQRLMTVSLASALPVAGTYVVSSQDGTTVQVSLKAMQDGGDASALQGKDLPGIYDLLVPIGYIFEWAPVDGGPDLSTPEKVAEYFGFGTWAAYASGKVMAGVNSSHGIGTSVGAETHAITVNEMPSHAHNYNGWAVDIPSGGTSGIYALAKPYDQYNNFGMNTQSSGGGAAMSLMQPTTYVYIWQRIS